MAQTPVVFDKAAWHLDSVREQGLDPHQALIHGGLFFGWAVDRGLVAPWLAERDPDGFARYRARALTGPGLLARWDGAIVDDQFTPEGLAFVAEYFDPRTGAFFSDYLGSLAKGLPSDYHVADTPENAARLAALLDRRHAEWRRGWDGVAPEPRADVAPIEAPVGGRLPLLRVTSGIVLPGGPIGIRATRPDAVAAVEAARDGVLVLGFPETRGRGPAPLLPIGVLARLAAVRIPDDAPGSRDVSLSCLGRVTVADLREDPEDRLLTAAVGPLAAADPDPAALAELRRLAATEARARAIRGEPAGGLGLAAVLDGEAAVDAVARELPLSWEEQVLLLCSPDPAARADLVRSALLRR